MVKTNELMLGNQLTIGKGSDWEENVAIDEIFVNSVGLKGREFTTYITTLEPIPISEELLIKNGFNKNVLIEGDDFIDDFIEYEKCIDGFFVTFRQTSNTIDRDWRVHIDNCNRSTCCGCDVQYIHQVQNIANILGFSIEFEL